MRVVFVQKFVPHYRLPFFEGLRARLAEDGHELVLLYGEPDPFEGSKVRMAYPDWGIRTPSSIRRVAGRYLYWQGAHRHVKRGDLVVVEHAAKLLDNYLLFLMRQAGRIRLGYFGHGQNFQAKNELAISAWVKRRMLADIDRWFAYTSVSHDSLVRQGVSDERITVVNNTLKPAAGARPNDVPEPLTFAYVGGLYREKLLPLLVDACTLVAEARHGFVLEVVGDGPDAPWLREQASTRPWLRVHGSLYGEERDAVLVRSAAILMPGLVGLIVVDAFQFARPLITSDAGEHSPEIAYLEDGVNALVTHGESITARDYADTVLRFIDDPDLVARLRAGCLEAAERYSIKAMVDNFHEGVRAVFDADGKGKTE